MQPGTPLLPVDRWVAFVNLVLLLAWLPYAGREPTAALLSLAHVGGLVLPALLIRARAPLSPATSLLRLIYPLLFAAVCWNEFGYRNDLLPGFSNDALVAAWDRGLFGVHLNLLWVDAMPWLPLSEIFQSVYFSYYLLLATIPILLWQARDRGQREEIILRVAVTYLACFVIYSYLPVVGPRELWPIHQGDLTSGFFYQINLALRSAGDSLGTAFPSSHTAGAVTAAWLAWRFGSGRVARAVAVLAGLIAASTIYTQNHFAVDMVAGVLVATLCQWRLVPWLMRQPAPVAPAGTTSTADPQFALTPKTEY